jgi:hypothetical protein
VVEEPAPVEVEQPAPVEVEAPKDPITIAAEAAGAVDSPAADPIEATALIETTTDDQPSGEIDLSEIATVPRSRRAQAQARREAALQSKAEKAAGRAAARSGKGKAAPADVLVARFPGIHPAWASIITGAISGLICVLLAKGASAGCEAINDNSSCGGGLGLLALVAILAIEVLIGANLLKAWKVSDPFSTSFLGVGLVAMVAMLFFLDVIDKASMVGVIPAITAVSFLLSWWVTVRFVEEPEGYAEDEDEEDDADESVEDDEDAVAEEREDA